MLTAHGSAPPNISHSTDTSPATPSTTNANRASSSQVARVRPFAAVPPARENFIFLHAIRSPVRGMFKHEVRLQLSTTAVAAERRRRNTAPMLARGNTSDQALSIGAPRFRGGPWRHLTAARPGTRRTLGALRRIPDLSWVKPSHEERLNVAEGGAGTTYRAVRSYSVQTAYAGLVVRPSTSKTAEVWACTSHVTYDDCCALDAR